MERRVKIIEHQGKFIFYGDYSGLEQEEILHYLEKLEKLSTKYTCREVLHLLNITDTDMDSETKERVDMMVERLSCEGCTIRTACFGVNGLKRFIANMGKKDIYFAKSEREAKDWLISDT